MALWVEAKFHPWKSLSSWLLDQPTTDVSLFVPPRVHRRLGNIPLRGSPGRRRTALSLEILESEGSIWSGGGSRQRRGRSLLKALRESLRDQLPFDMFSGKRAWEGSSIRSLDKGIRSMTAEKRERIAKLMLEIPHMLVDYQKRRWEKKMKEEEKAKKDE
ncbi:unnamed protein product [Brassica napus]|uniref:(rape) hypothetical protein n=1 Tax=Brassica napus TaxID=3708 RepID=A0A816W9P5_BRANA|nr:unnamed protein product [Brassica napus]